MKEMKILTVGILIFLVLTLFLSLVFAEDIPQYNFGTMQAGKSFSVQPGQEITTKLYFYNIYGNRPTHIKLSVIEKPENWQVEIIPDVAKKEYDVSGQKVSVDENLVVYPSNATETAGTNTETIEYIQSSVGYIASNFVTIKIKVPENEKIGVSKNIKINGIASWLGQTGNIALNQERDFDYSVSTTTSSTSYYEKPYEEPAATTTTNTTEIGKKILSLFSSESQIKPIYLVMTGMTLVLVVIFIILLVLIKRKIKKESRKRGKKNERKNN